MCVCVCVHWQKYDSDTCVCVFANVCLCVYMYWVCMCLRVCVSARECVHVLTWNLLLLSSQNTCHLYTVYSKNVSIKQTNLTWYWVIVGDQVLVLPGEVVSVIISGNKGFFFILSLKKIFFIWATLFLSLNRFLTAQEVIWLCTESFVWIMKLDSLRK